MKKNLLAALVVALTIISTVQAQDPMYSQFFTAPSYLNPAFTGSTYAPRFILNYRNQWPNFSNAYLTYSASYDQLVGDLNSGFGVFLLSDEAGDGIYRNNMFKTSYAYRFKLQNDMYLKGGIQAGITQARISWQRLIFLDQIDPITGSIGADGSPNPTQETTPSSFNRTYVDMGGGLLLYNKTYYVGASISHINAPDESLLQNNFEAIVPVRLVVQAGGEINIRKHHRKYLEGIFISPNVLYLQQNEFRQLNAGLYASTSKVFGGLWFRHTFANADALIALVGFQHHIFKVGYSYDFTVSGIGAQTGGAHEVSVTINFDNDPDIRRRQRAKRYTDCLQMFR